MLLSTYINFTRILGSKFSQSIVTSKYCYQQCLLLTQKQCTWNQALLCWGTSAQEPTHPPIGDRCCSHMTSLTPSLCWLCAITTSFHFCSKTLQLLYKQLLTMAILPNGGQQVNRSFSINAFSVMWNHRQTPSITGLATAGLDSMIVWWPRCGLEGNI